MSQLDTEQRILSVDDGLMDVVINKRMQNKCTVQTGHPI